MNTRNQRLLCLDLLRASAIVLMIIFHFAFDLDVFGLIDIDILSDPFWWFLPRLIVFLFLLAVGASLVVSAVSIQQNPAKMLRRFFKLALLALLISLFTYFTFRPSWIYFGTLHCIALCSLLAWPLLLLKPRARLSLSLLIALFLWAPILLDANFRWPFLKLNHPSMDYIPVLPWFGIVTLGMALVDLRFFHWLEAHTHQIFTHPLFKPFLWSGRHSLKIYLAHQPLLYGGVWLAYLLLN